MRWCGSGRTRRWRPRCSTRRAAGVALVAGGLCAAADQRSARGSRAADAAGHARPLYGGVRRTRSGRPESARRRCPRSGRSWSSATADPAVVIQAMRGAWRRSATRRLIPLLVKLVADRERRPAPASRGADRARRAGDGRDRRPAARAAGGPAARHSGRGACGRWRGSTPTSSWPRSPGSSRIRTGPCARRRQPRSARCRPSAACRG